MYYILDYWLMCVLCLCWSVTCPKQSVKSTPASKVKTSYPPEQYLHYVEIAILIVVFAWITFTFSYVPYIAIAVTIVSLAPFISLIPRLFSSNDKRDLSKKEVNTISLFECILYPILMKLAYDADSVSGIWPYVFLILKKSMIMSFYTMSVLGIIKNIMNRYMRFLSIAYKKIISFYLYDSYLLKFTYKLNNIEFIFIFIAMLLDLVFFLLSFTIITPLRELLIYIVKPMLKRIRGTSDTDMIKVVLRLSIITASIIVYYDVRMSPAFDIASMDIYSFISASIVIPVLITGVQSLRTHS